MQHYSDQDLYKWLWEVVMYLHLHDAEYPASVMGFTDSPQSTSDDQGGHNVPSTIYDRGRAFGILQSMETLLKDVVHFQLKLLELF